MATNQYYLKDKKVDLIRVETVTQSGVTKKKYYEWLNGLWCYFKYLNGSVTLSGSAIKVYDNKERIQVVINNLPELRQRGITTFLVRYAGRYYNVLQVDNYEGYAEDLKLVCELDSTTKIEPLPPNTAQ